MNSLGKTILITGASRGIGRAIAKACAPYFDTMLFTCKKSEAELLTLKEELEQAYPITCIPFIGDMGDPAFVSSIFNGITLRHFPPLDSMTWDSPACLTTSQRDFLIC